MGRTYQSIVVKAPLERVWKAIRDFHDISWAPGVVTKVTAVGKPKGNQIGAKRVINDAFHETLLELSEVEHRVRYSIDDGPSPVSSKEVKNYIGDLHLLPVTEGKATFVEWASSWEAKNNAAEEFCHTIYVALLNELKKKFS